MRSASSPTGEARTQASSAAWAKIEAVILKARSLVPRHRAAGPGSATGTSLEAGFRGQPPRRPNRQGVFAVGRTIFVHAAEQWLAGKMSA